ncbi:BlaI/MecI/CopY family transcriptional regulator [Cytophagia bacterium CHB2]|nr:BlaI/MecI/CopY family transcriptional regulator [Cytophagia bacterium CHB2]
MDFALNEEQIMARDMVREIGASPNTLKATFGSLVKKGLLTRNGGGRSTWYGQP